MPFLSFSFFFFLTFLSKLNCVNVLYYCVVQDEFASNRRPSYETLKVYLTIKSRTMNCRLYEPPPHF